MKKDRWISQYIFLHSGKFIELNVFYSSELGFYQSKGSHAYAFSAWERFSLFLLRSVFDHKKRYIRTQWYANALKSRWLRTQQAQQAVLTTWVWAQDCWFRSASWLNSSWGFYPLSRIVSLNYGKSHVARSAGKLAAVILPVEADDADASMGCIN